MIYLDNAATTVQNPPQVAEAMVHALCCAGNSARGIYENSLQASRMIFNARVRLAELFGCPRPDRVAFTYNLTEALNGLIRPGAHVISTDLEHNSVLRPMYRLRDEQGVQLDFLPADSLGNPEYEKLPALLRPNTSAIVSVHASNLTGNLVDLEILSAFAQAHDLLLIVDAAQTAGTVPINMAGCGIDVLCFSGHKGLMGPQGVGGLCVREGLKIRPLKVGGSGVQSFRPTQPEQMPTCLEAGTLNTPGIAGLSAAVDYIHSVGIDVIHAKEIALMQRFYEGIRDLPRLRIYGDFSGDRTPVLAMNLGDADSGAVADLLASEYGIAVRAGAHCAPRMHCALGTREQGAVRFSFSWFNTEAETDAAIRAVREIAETV